MKQLESFLTSDKSMKTILTEAQQLLSDSDRWCKNAPALDADCGFARPTQPQAVAWDLVGAVARCSNSEGICPPALLKYLDHVVEKYTEGKYDQAEAFNDIATHESLMELFQLAIEEAP